MLSKESYRGVGTTMCCSLNCYQHFHQQMMGLFRHDSKKKCLRKEPSTHWIFHEGYIKEEIATMQNL